MFVTYLLHGYLLDPHNANTCLCAFETGIADSDIEHST